MTDSNQKNNDPLEELFQQKAEEYDISYREEDWLRLENRLDRWDAQSSARRWRRLAAAAIIVIFSLLAYFTYQNYQELNTLNDQISQNEELILPLPQLQNEIQSDSESNQTNTEDPGSTELAADDSENSMEESQSQETVDEEQLTPNQATNRFLQSSMNTIAQAEIPHTTGNLSTLEEVTAHNPSGLKLAGLSTRYRQDAPPPKSVVTTSAPIASESTVAQRSFPKASIGLVAGPDMSTVGSISNFYNPGSKVGVTVDYNISRNLSVSIGAIHSTVRYKADGQEYQPPEGYWNYGTHADHTIGECLLIDIPINLSYRFLHFDHSRIYASAGFSSYVMLSEDYRFTYDNNGSGLPQRWNEHTGTTHFMSNANFSVGYELDIVRNLSLRAEPFLRVPISRVGWGNVNLYSVGTLVSLNYHLR